jgi:hypothetical protein
MFHGPHELRSYVADERFILSRSRHRRTYLTYQGMVTMRRPRMRRDPFQAGYHAPMVSGVCAYLCACVCLYVCVFMFATAIFFYLDLLTFDFLITLIFSHFHHTRHTPV